MEASPLEPLAAAVLHVPAPERALVVGCDDGGAALFLAREFPGARVRGVDRSPDRIREAQAKVGLDPEGRVAFKQAGRRSLPYPDEFFDLIAQTGGPLLPAETARVLRPGGFFIHALLRPPRFAPAPRRRLLEWRLAQHYFEPRQEGEAGDGNFFVARLDRNR
ncbi:MAG TPA: class I SAM-dependent methyltransferase [Solirubrobacterales bacterium]|nr:class I SAM-dependent methyltransferase [Solirubrobacterales bacterium]